MTGTATPELQAYAEELASALNSGTAQQGGTARGTYATGWGTAPSTQGEVLLQHNSATVAYVANGRGGTYWVRYRQRLGFKVNSGTAPVPAMARAVRAHATAWAAHKAAQ